MRCGIWWKDLCGSRECPDFYSLLDEVQVSDSENHQRRTPLLLCHHLETPRYSSGNKLHLFLTSLDGLGWGKIIKVIMMGAGQYHMVVATTERQLFFWGDLKIDFKGDAPKDISSLLPSTFKWPPRQISCSHHSFGLVDSNKKAFCSARQPLSIMQLRFSNVKQLEMRSFHTVVLTEDGTVWQSGEHNDGRMRRVTTGVKSLGIGAWGTATLIMKSGGAQKLSEGGNLFSHSLRDGERVLRAADGHTSSLWLTSHGVVEVTHSKLGSEKRYPPFAATATAPPPSSGDEQLLHNDSSSLCKVCAAADYSSPKQHYAALTRWGDVFTWGYCPSFECGVRMCKSVEAPGVVPWVPPGSCLDVVTGENFTAVLLTGQPSSLDMRFPWIKNQCNN
ncbi:hypothetical protein Pelo_5381 [Pelomyxa schiedti]|nr:hypothetical protein Pelo_5381 [Pelomyxa schiedti]